LDTISACTLISAVVAAIGYLAFDFLLSPATKPRGERLREAVTVGIIAAGLVLLMALPALLPG